MIQEGNKERHKERAIQENLRFFKFVWFREEKIRKYRELSTAFQVCLLFYQVCLKKRGKASIERHDCSAVDRHGPVVTSYASQRGSTKTRIAIFG
jgi:hypothetical protein